MSGQATLIHVCLAMMLLTSVLLQEAVSSPLPSIMEKRRSGGRRMPRARHRGAYMFGKRASPIESLSSLSSSSSSSQSLSSPSLLDVINRRALTDSQLASVLQHDPETLQKIVSLVDKDGNGYITMGDFL